MSRIRATVSMALIVAVLIIPAGCARKVEPQVPAAAPTATPTAPATPASIEQMSPSEKRALAPGFPIEVPVPKGAVLESTSQGVDVYVYKIAISAPVEAVAAWYREAYRVRDWAAGEPKAGGGSSTQVFQKAGAQSEVRLTDNGNGTDAVVSVGIGVPVGDTY